MPIGLVVVVVVVEMMMGAAVVVVQDFFRVRETVVVVVKRIGKVKRVKEKVITPQVSLIIKHVPKGNVDCVEKKVPVYHNYYIFHFFFHQFQIFLGHIRTKCPNNTTR